VRKTLFTFVTVAILVCSVAVAANPRESKSRQDNAQAEAVRQQQMERASLFMARKQFADATLVYLDLTKKYPRDSSLWNFLGIAYHQQGMYSQALKSYERASKVNKASGDAWNNIGTVYYQQLKYSKAVRAYRRAIQITPDNSVFYSNLGMAYLDAKKFPEALDSFHHALALNPDVFANSSGNSTVLQSRSIKDHGMFYFLLAKSFAADGNAESCANYLKKSRDEGYDDFVKAKTDPAFSKVILNTSVREVLGLPAIPAGVPKSQGI
jgi:Tfp pilus assembly protein PilF